ncbi:bifunctional riboflavin kinase/FAD synthetase [Rhodohalobacter barkolensis]|uniref:Riboflavin biosynthesis protein n=1 Tax=Rhodohalobacter barkolensis TaxID=2053187 RepID=A0A2N0VJN1_9BACT|nr:bifunctional riboflavin kinase/FAD synthetase [Rhodohalobacter barkolensis]PKD44401.1 bifunctional riboflavin kinase/FMN adenylyltransferase [Rhodohalobacter barkolensis]
MADIVFLKNVERDLNTVLTVGTFDGVHAGHKVLINSVISSAKERNARSVIVTFDPHPRDIINPGSDGIRLLSTLEERSELLADLEVDEMVVIPFDRDFSLLTSEQFVRDIVWEKIGVKEFVIGYDHHFGRNREGTIETVQRLGEELGFKSSVVSKQEVGDKTVSSTAIRNAIQKEGDMLLAASFLERYYILNGTVVHGDKRGKQIGYPTANIQPQNTKKIVPKRGVYAVWLRVDGKYHGGMMNIGVRPTFEGEQETLEVNIFDFDKNIYGKEVQIQFVDRIRDERSFKGVEQLKAQLRSDETNARMNLKNHSPDIAKQFK